MWHVSRRTIPITNKNNPVITGGIIFVSNRSRSRRNILHNRPSRRYAVDIDHIPGGSGVLIERA